MKTLPVKTVSLPRVEADDIIAYLSSTSASYASSSTSASYALVALSVQSGIATPGTLTNSTGISALSFNGGESKTIAVSGAADLTTNRITKWTGTAFANASLFDDGTNVTGSTSIQLIGANSILTGSFTGSFTGSLFGTASYVSGSVFTSANPALSASYASGSTSASYASSSTSASYTFTASYVTGSIFSGSNLALSASYALTASYALNSIPPFPYTGSAIITGSLIITGSTTSTLGFTGSLLGTASYVSGAIFNTTNPALSASYASGSTSASYSLTSSYALNSIPPFPYTGSAIITGSLIVTGSTTSTLGFTGSLFGTASYISGSIFTNINPALSASYASSSTSASYAATASYIPTIKAGNTTTFAGTPLSSSIIFTTSFPDNNYAVTVTGLDARSWTIPAKFNSGFTINSNSTVALTGPVYWIAVPYNS